MSVIETADRLLELMFKWIRESEAFAQQLEKMADKLESLREKCNDGETVGSTYSVAGAACLLGASAATLLTGGVASPLIILTGGTCTGVGTVVSIASQLTEYFSSSSTMKKVQEKEKEINNIAKAIERQLEQLKMELMKLSPHIDPDDLDQQVMMAFMAAVGRRSGNNQVIRFLKHMSFFGGGRLRNMSLQTNGLRFRPKLPMLQVLRVLAVFAWKFKGKKLESLFEKATEKLAKKMSPTAFRWLNGGAMVVSGAVGLGFALAEAIDRWKELIKKNHVTEASQSLRDTANDILEMTRNVKEPLDNIRKELERSANELVKIYTAAAVAIIAISIVVGGVGSAVAVAVTIAVTVAVAETVAGASGGKINQPLQSAKSQSYVR